MPIKRRAPWLCVAGLVTLVSGCYAPRVDPVEHQVHTMVDQNIADSAAAIQEHLVRLSAMEKATLPPAEGILKGNLSGIQGLVSIDWSGPIGPLMRHLAKISHYKLRVLGKPPAVPIIISMHSYRKSLSEILRDISFQAGNRASVKVLDRESVIELRYHR